MTVDDARRYVDDLFNPIVNGTPNGMSPGLGQSRNGQTIDTVAALHHHFNHHSASSPFSIIEPHNPYKNNINNNINKTNSNYQDQNCSSSSSPFQRLSHRHPSLDDGQ